MPFAFALILLLTSGHFQAVLSNDNGVLDAVSDKGGKFDTNWKIPLPDITDGRNGMGHSFDDTDPFVFSGKAACCSFMITSLHEDPEVGEKAKELRDQQSRFQRFSTFVKRKILGQGKRKTKFDPALRFMGLGKRSHPYETGSKHIFKRESKNDMVDGLTKRDENYNPGLKFIGLGKKYNGYNTPSFIPEKHISHQNARRKQSMAPLFYTRSNSWKYDPALKIMGLGKRNDDGNSVLLEKRNQRFHHKINLFNFEDAARLRKFPFGRFIQGQGKRQRIYDPALKYMGLGKRSYNNDQTQDAPLLMYKENHGIGTQSGENDDPTLINRRKRSVLFSFDGDYSNNSISSEEPKMQKSFNDRRLEHGSMKYGRSVTDVEHNESICASNYNPGNHTTDVNSQTHSSHVNRDKRYLRSKFFAKFGLRQSEGFTRYFDPKRTEFAPPKFDPGWKFIGLGKRSSGDNSKSDLLNADHSETDSREGRDSTPRPYRSVSNSIGALIYKSGKSVDDAPKSHNEITDYGTVVPAGGLSARSIPSARDEEEFEDSVGAAAES